MSIELVPLNSIFEVRAGSKLDFNKMSKCAPDEQAIAFIVRSGERNGFAGFVERLDMVKPYESGLITVALGGSTLASFVQPRPFYTAQNINILRPRSPMSLDQKLYYCLCIEANRFRYSTFGREANRTLKTIEIPALHHAPAWIKGAVKTAVNEFSNELLGLVEMDGEATMAHRREYPGVALALDTHTKAESAISTATEDVRDAEIAKATLKKIDANPKGLVSGDDLGKKLAELIS